MQRIVVDHPPNYQQILAVLPAASKRGVIFSYGDLIYNPSGLSIPREIQAHEAEHGRRQIALGIDEWWTRYIRDPLFRLDEEIYGHHAEWKAATRRHGPRPRDIERIAARLASPLYGGLLTIGQAKHAIITGVVQ